MKRILILLLGILIGCSSQKSVIKQDALNNGKIEVSTVGNPEPHKADMVIAIIPFKNNSSDSNLDKIGITLLDLISAKLSTKKGYKLVERNKLEEMIKEMKLGTTGIIDQNTAISIGKMLGANVITLGSYSLFEKRTLLTLRLVKVDTGEIIGGVVERGNDISEFDILAEKVAQKIMDSIK